MNQKKKKYLKEVELKNKKVPELMVIMIIMRMAATTEVVILRDPEVVLKQEPLEKDLLVDNLVLRRNKRKSLVESDRSSVVRVFEIASKKVSQVTQDATDASVKSIT